MEAGQATASGGEGNFRIAVLASGEGTNLQALIDATRTERQIQIVAVAGDKPEAQALARARAADIECRAFPSSEHADRAERDAELASWLETRKPDLVVLAGYMQILSPSFVRQFGGRAINVHPSLLPAFPGLAAIEQAFEYGVKIYGVTVHAVDEGVDSGTIIAQAALPLDNVESPEQVHRQLRPLEHELLTQTVLAIARGEKKLDS